MPSSSNRIPGLDTVDLSAASGSLELLTCTPSPPIKHQPILCVHGAQCAAADFKLLLPLLARAGYPSYALSVRGHGASWQPSTFAFHALTSLTSYVADVTSALDLIMAEHPDTQPILVGHSMGGAILQRMLGAWDTLGRPNVRPAGLVLLAAAPLSGGGMDIGKRWQAAEAAWAATQPPAPPRPFSARLRGLFVFEPKTGLETPPQVRNKFFSKEASDEVMEGWLRDSKGRMESIRVSIEHMWPFAEAGNVLAAIRADAPLLGRKILAISGGKDVLVSKEVSRETFDAYRLAARGEEEVMRVELSASGHHVMLDVEHERCARIIVEWIEGREVENFNV